MNLIFMGAPGAGKGTIAKMIVEKYQIVQISTGDILRKAVKDKTEIGSKVESIITAGDLVPDGLILELIKNRIIEKDCANGFIFDGFPRTIPQAEGLDEIIQKYNIKIDAAINLDVPKEVVVKRLSSRRTCSNSDCQAIYNMISNPPEKEGCCDKCGSSVIQRDDETEEAILHRLETYQEKTAPLIDFYNTKGLLIEINGDQSPDNVFNDFIQVIKQ